MNVLVYHGSPHKFTEFSFKNIGKESGLDAGHGLYFSESKGDALTYGKNIYTCMLTLRKNLSTKEVTLSKNVISLLLKNLGETDIFNKVRDLSVNCKSDIEIIGKLVEFTKIGKKTINFKPIGDILSKYGYTHTTDNDTPDDPTITHYIVYNIDSIKILDKEYF